MIGICTKEMSPYKSLKDPRRDLMSSKPDFSLILKENNIKTATFTNLYKACITLTTFCL